MSETSSSRGPSPQRVKGGLSRHDPRWRQGVPARLAGRPSPGPQPGRVHRPEPQVQGHQVQQEARQHRSVAPRAPREGARRPQGVDARAPEGRPGRRGHRQEPHRVRRLHRPRRHRRSPPHHRHELGPGQSPERAVPGRRPRAGQGPQVQRRRPSASRWASSRSARIPWSRAAEKYVPGTVVRGKVVSLKDYGAFIELEEGIEGLVHISEMSWTRRVKHPSKVVAVGDVVEAVVLDVDVRAEPHLPRHEAARAEPVRAAHREVPDRHRGQGPRPQHRRLRHLRGDRGRHRRPGPHQRHVVDPAREAPAASSSRRATRSRRCCRPSTPTTARSRRSRSRIKHWSRTPGPASRTTTRSARSSTPRSSR